MSPHRRFKLKQMIVIPIISAIPPTTSQNDDPPVIHSQSAKHNKGRSLRIVIPCNNHNSPRATRICPINVITTCFNIFFIVHAHTKKYVVYLIKKIPLRFTHIFYSKHSQLCIIKKIMMPHAGTRYPTGHLPHPRIYRWRSRAIHKYLSA